jgi:hypothetical protein
VLLKISLIISSGAETDRYRDIVLNVAADVQHLFTNELEQPVAFTGWDYRRDNPRVVPGGDLSARSLLMVERSECVLAIFGRSVPKVTSEEIVRVFERRQAGEPIDFWLLLNPDEKSAEHQTFLDSIMTRFGEQIVYSHYRSELEFQARVMTTLTAHVIRRLRYSPLAVQGESHGPVV